VLGLAVILRVDGGALIARTADRAQMVHTGPSAALASCEGLDAQSDNRARASFPRFSEVHVRVRLSGGIGQAPVSDAVGNLIIAHAEPKLSKLDGRGRSLWSVRLPSEAAGSPVLLANGAILTTTRDADAIVFRGDGQLQYRRSLPIADPRRRTCAIPTASGGVLLASGADLIELDAQADLVRQSRAQSNVVSLAESGSALVAVSENGNVERARATGDFELIGNFGGMTPEGGAVTGSAVLAVVDRHRLVSLNLMSGQTLTLSTDPALSLTGPLALFARGGGAVVAEGGFVSVRAPSGAEALRVSIATGAQSFDAAARGLRPALLITDELGAVAAVRAESEALLLYADGTSTRFDDTACLDPFRPTPTRDGIAFACRSGQLFLVRAKPQ
jgi:hypothetical protein